MPTEVAIRKRIASFAELVPELNGRVHDRGRTTVTDLDKVKLCFDAELGYTIGAIVRLAAPPREVSVGPNRVRRQMAYIIEVLLTARDNWDDTQSSEDYIINTLVEPLYAVFRERVDLGFLSDPERVEHQYLQGVRDFSIPKSNEVGPVIVSTLGLEVWVYVPAVQLCYDME